MQNTLLLFLESDNYTDLSNTTECVNSHFYKVYTENPFHFYFVNLLIVLKSMILWKKLLFLIIMDS